MARGRPSKKGLIADAAQALFRVSGYQGTTIDQVVIEAGVSKPTVYSNYPSKLLLWQEVLRNQIAAGEVTLARRLQQLVEQNISFCNGWLALWQDWCSCPNRMATYRIHWGEQHKFSASEVALFNAFEALLKQYLQQWMAHCHIPSERFFVLQAIAREAYLIARLSPPAVEPPDISAMIVELSQ